eukprot:NODE_914_length_3092_cov_0.758102.p2 type:complete len:224 gc:universal NODE_914_length_3092_cov_0.758102:2982-2311(-)
MSLEKIRIAVWGSGKSGKSTFIKKMSSNDSGICNLSLHFSQKFNKNFYVEWLEIPDLKSEKTLKFLLNTCNAVVIVIEAFDLNQYIVNQFTSVIDSMHTISNSSKSYSESQQNLIKEYPVLITSSKIDIYEKAPADVSKYAVIHNIEEVALNLLDPLSVESNMPKINVFIDEVIEELFHFNSILLNNAELRMENSRSISKHRLEIRSASSSMGSLKSIPDMGS